MALIEKKVIVDVKESEKEAGGGRFAVDEGLAKQLAESGLMPIEAARLILSGATLVVDRDTRERQDSPE